MKYETPYDRPSRKSAETDTAEMGETEKGGGEEEMKCKYLSDDFSEVCTNADCPVCADFCPVTNYPEICKFAEEDDNG